MRSIACLLWVLLVSPAAFAESPSLIEVDGPSLIAKARQGSSKLTVINVWATWCAPCLEEFPDLLAVGRAYKAKGVQLLFITTDFGDARNDAVRFLKKQGASMPSYVMAGKDEAFINAMHPKWFGTLPATFIFDKTGKRVFFHQGRLKREKIEQALDRLLGA